MNHNPPQNKSWKQRFKSFGSLLGAGVVILVYFMITGDFGLNRDFTGEDLRDRGDEFRRADLVSSVLSQANISGLDMLGCNLHRADLTNAIADTEQSLVTGTPTDLTQAKFPDADLSGANLRGAILVEANLQRTNLTGADLRGADLRGARLDGAILTDADLRDVRIGPFCGTRQGRPAEHCESQEDGSCCEMIWQPLEVGRLKVCRNPFSELFSTLTNRGTGEVELFEANTIDERGRTLCEQTLMR
jgi:hypothetical protein